MPESLEYQERFEIALASERFEETFDRPSQWPNFDNFLAIR